MKYIILKWIQSGIRLAFLPILAMAMLFAVIGQGTLYAQNAKNATPIPPETDLYLRAPEVIPGTLPEMRDASYWIAKMESPDKVVLTLEEIRERNKEYRQRMADPSGLGEDMSERIHKETQSRPGLMASLPDLGPMSPEGISALTQLQIDKGIQYMRGRSFGNILGIGYSSRELDEMENEMSYSKDRTRPRSGITVTEARLRIVPSIRPEYIGLTSTGKARWDLWNLDVLPIGSEVHVLHTSRSGGFLFVASERGYGWVPSEKVAIASAAEIDDFIGADDFVVSTGDKVPFYSDMECTIVSGWIRMGNRLPLKNKDDARIVQVPTRRTDGKFLVQEAWLRPDADVNQGYLPYTRKNVVQQAFKLLDNIYDWTGGWYGRNHATVLRDIFACFGFELPASGVLLSAYGSKPRTVGPDQGRDAQFASMLSNRPFLTLQVCRSGHSQLYMGDYNRMPIVFDTHGYGYPDKDGNELEIRRWVVGTVQLPGYFLKQDITFVELY